MDKKQCRNCLKSVICLLLIVASVCLVFTGCKQKEAANTAAQATGTEENVTRIGTGKTSFRFDVIDLDENKSSYLICTDKKTVGEALLENKLIDGEDSEYGFVVISTLDIPLDFYVDNAYWAFYIDGEYAMSYVNQTEIDENAVYMLKAEKA